MMPGRAVDRVVLTGPIHRRQKLVDDKTSGSLLDVLAVRPPSIIVSSQDVIVRAIQEWDVVLQKIPSRRVWIVASVQLIVLLVKLLDKVAERPCRKHRTGRLNR